MKTNYILIDFENVHVSDLTPLEGHPVKVIIFLGAKQTMVPVELAESQQRIASPVEYVRTTGGKKNALDFHIAFAIGQLAAREPEAFFHVISKDEGYDPLLQHLRKQKLHAFRAATITEIGFVRNAREKQVSALRTPPAPTEEANRRLAELALGWVADEDTASGVPSFEDLCAKFATALEGAQVGDPIAADDDSECHSIVAFATPPRTMTSEKATAVKKATTTREQKIHTLTRRLSRPRTRPRKLTALRNFIGSQFGSNLTLAEVDDLIKDLKKRGCISVSEQKVSYHSPAAS